MSAWAGPEDFDTDSILASADPDEVKKQKLESIFLDAASTGDENVVHDIVEIAAENQSIGVDINVLDAAECSALLTAATYGYEPIVAELLRAGADCNKADPKGWTPLMWAVYGQHLDIVKLLLSNGADINAKNDEGTEAPEMAPEGSLVHYYLVSEGLKTDSSTNEFYHGAAIDDDENIPFTSSQRPDGASGGVDLGITDLSIEDQDEGMPPMDDFDWDTYHPSQAFALNYEDVPRLLDHVVSNIKPSLRRGQAPLSANCIFLGARYLLNEHGENEFFALLDPLRRRVELACQSNPNDLSYVTYWLANIQVLLYYIRRDRTTNPISSGEENPALEELSRNLIFAVTRAAEDLLTPHIRSCLLEYTNIPGLSNVELRGDWHWRRKKDINEQQAALQTMLPPTMEQKMRPSPTKITQILSSILLLLQIYGVHPLVILEIYGQLFYWLAAIVFNEVVDTPRYLTRTRAIQVRLNLSVIEDWSRNNNFRPSDASSLTGNTSIYKSLSEVCSSQIAPLTQLLQWLQTFTSFGDDFTNVVATLQELKSLNPKLLLNVSKRYRPDVQETPLSKEYRDYLGELSRHYEQTLSEQFENGEIVDDSIVLKTCPPQSVKHVTMDPTKSMPLRLPTLKEGIDFWGGGIGGSRTEEKPLYVPFVPGDVCDALDADQAKQKLELSVSPPDNLQKTILEDEEDYR